MLEISPVTFKSACVISDNLVYLSASLDNLDDDSEYSRCILFDYNEGLKNGWYCHDLEFDVVSVCYNNNEENKKIIRSVMKVIYKNLMVLTGNYLLLKVQV